VEEALRGELAELRPYGAAEALAEVEQVMSDAGASLVEQEVGAAPRELFRPSQNRTPGLWAYSPLGGLARGLLWARAAVKSSGQGEGRAGVPRSALRPAPTSRGGSSPAARR